MLMVKNLPTNATDKSSIPWRWALQPTPVFSPGKSRGQGSLAGYSPWGHKELDLTEQLSTRRGTEIDFISYVNNNSLPVVIQMWS